MDYVTDGFFWALYGVAFLLGAGLALCVVVAVIGLIGTVAGIVITAIRVRRIP